MRAKFINEFVRGGDPLDTLGIGYEAKIHKFFDDLEISRNNYTILEDRQITFRFLDLSHCTIVIELPDNLYIENDFYLMNCKNLIKLPNNLTVDNNLWLNSSDKIVELPDDLIVHGSIYIREEQKELRNWIENSKFANKLIIK